MALIKTAWYLTAYAPKGRCAKSQDAQEFVEGTCDFLFRTWLNEKVGFREYRST